MFDAGKLFARRTADALRGRFGRDEIGKVFLQFLKLLEQSVIFAVGNLRLAFDIISVVMPADFGGESGVARFGGGVCHAGIFNAKKQRSKAAKKEFSLLHAVAALR